jgi:cell wall-associated NlpC family hydrolase
MPEFGRARRHHRLFHSVASADILIRMSALRCRVPLLAAAVLALLASACAERQPRIRVLPPAPGATAAGAEIVRIAETLIGAPYREGGTLPDGFDCSGLVTYVFAREGIAVPRDVRGQAAAGEEVPRDALRAGDLVFFSTTGPGPTHVGIALGDGRFVHAPKSGALVRIESLASAYWTTRFVTARRVFVPGG